MAERRILVARALRGDADAFEDIFDRYGGLMLSTAYRIVKDRDSAEDAVQNAFIQAWQHLPNLHEMGALRSWLLRIVVNQCISFKRRLARSTIFLSQSLSEQETFLAFQMALRSGVKRLKAVPWLHGTALSRLRWPLSHVWLVYRLSLAFPGL